MLVQCKNLNVMATEYIKQTETLCVIWNTYVCVEVPENPNLFCLQWTQRYSTTWINAQNLEHFHHACRISHKYELRYLWPESNGIPKTACLNINFCFCVSKDYYTLHLTQHDFDPTAAHIQPMNHTGVPVILFWTMEEKPQDCYKLNYSTISWWGLRRPGMVHKQNRIFVFDYNGWVNSSLRIPLRCSSGCDWGDWWRSVLEGVKPQEKILFTAKYSKRRPVVQQQTLHMESTLFPTCNWNVTGWFWSSVAWLS